MLAAGSRAANYYRTTYSHTDVTPTNGWSWATYFNGVQALYTQTGNSTYLNDGLAWGAANGWKPSTEADPNSIKSAQDYYDLHAVSTTASLTAVDATLAADLTNQAPSAYDWIDALFMGLPDYPRWSAQTGDAAYLTKMDSDFAWTMNEGGTSSRCKGKSVPQAGLFSSSQGLWYRDCTFITKKDSKGKPIFWSRGNGWVIAAMAQVIQALPAGDPHAAKYISMLQTMAASLAPLQGSDGLWRASLEDPALYAAPETSGTALITYALAYGVKAGLLSPSTYSPIITLAWKGLSTVSLRSSGFVTDCQGPGSGPASPYTKSSPKTGATSTSSGSVDDNSPPFCVGAFLLASSEVAQLTQ